MKEKIPVSLFGKNCLVPLWKLAMLAVFAQLVAWGFIVYVFIEIFGSLTK